MLFGETMSVFSEYHTATLCVQCVKCKIFNAQTAVLGAASPLKSGNSSKSLNSEVPGGGMFHLEPKVLLNEFPV